MTVARWRYLLAAWWLATFGLTHVPLPALPIGPDVFFEADKLVHITIYGGLAFLADRAGWRTALGTAGLVASLLTMAVVDELTQIPVGRQASVYDWIADAAGVACGLAAACKIGAAKSVRTAPLEAD
ncbi:MAG: VanZ family protein [Planctomycetota bacterium]